jgi:hypothetical protein
MNTLRGIKISMVAPLAFLIMALSFAGSDRLTSASISQNSYQEPSAESDLLRQEVNLWKEKYQQLEARYRSLFLQQLVRELEEEVSRIRGLPLRHHVEYKTIKPEEVRQLLEAKINETYPQETLRYYSIVLKLLGVIDRDVDLKKIMLDLYTEQIAGFYDDATHVLYVVELFDIEKPFTRLILAHELCHALQDQNFSFDRLPLHAEENDDQQLAILSIIEGDAMVFTVDYMQRISPLSMLLEIPSVLALDQSRFGNAPYSIQQLLLFPYVQGSAFVQEVIRERGESGRNDLFRDYPRSSAQILRPERYFSSRDEPTTVTLADLSQLLGTRWRLAFSNVMGEFLTRVLFEIHLDAARALSASEGWKGDRFALYVNNADGHALLWQSVWKSERDAVEFLGALEATVQHVHGPAVHQWGDKGNGSSLRLQFQRNWASLSRTDNRVTLLLSTFEPRGKLLRKLMQPPSLRANP